MCLATPVKIISLKGSKAIVDSFGEEKEVDLSLIPNAKEGDWLLCHSELAINILDEQEAEKVLHLVSQCPHNHHT